MLELLDVSRIQWRFERVSRRVPVAEPWTAPIADSLDDQTLDRWLRSVHAGASTRDLMAIMSQGDMGLRTRRGVDAARRALRQGGRRASAACSTSRAARSRTASPAARSRSRCGWPTSWATRVRLQRGGRAHRAARRRHAHRRRRRRRRHRARRSIVAIPPEHRGAIDVRPRPACRVRQARAALAAGQPEQGLRRLRDAVLAGERLHRARRSPTRARSSSRSTSAPATTDPASCWASPTRARSIRCRPTSAASARWPVSPTLFGDAARQPDRLRRSLLGHRGIRARRADRRGAAGFVDDLRAVAAQAGGRHLLGGHRDRRPMDRLPRRRRPVGTTRGRRGARRHCRG